MNVRDLADFLHGKLLKNTEEQTKNIQVQGLRADSRDVKAGDVFFCLNGGKTDGHLFAGQAVEKGAMAIVSQRELALDCTQILVENSRIAMSKAAAAFYDFPSEKLKIIGITGTNGKTTTAYMLSSILKKAGKMVGTIGTLGVTYGDKSYNSELTTPDPITLHAIFADMCKCGVEYVVMEVSAHALHYHKLDGITFSACIFTNFTQDHLDFFKTMSNYKKAKLNLFQTEHCPLAIVNGDDEVGREIIRNRKENPLFQTAVYALDTPADAFAIITHEGLYSNEVMLNILDDLCKVSLSMIGRHNVYNALAAATCAYALGVSSYDIRCGLNDVNGVSGRLQYFGSFRGGDIFVDFAHTPDGLDKSLAVLKKHCKNRLICLFGCGGNRDKSKRPIMGETVAKKCDFAILTSDNPRYEDPLDIISDIEKGYRRFSFRYVIVADRKRAIDYALDFLQKGDILLVAGKGGENYQEIMGIKHPYNDNDILEKIVKIKRKTMPFEGK